MIRRFLSWLGWDVVYVCSWGTYSHRYDGCDLSAMRPIHPHMSVAPPWARRVIRRRARRVQP